MKLGVKSGKCVVAVSGGVDSMCLLDMLASSPEPVAASRGQGSYQLPAMSYELIVAHFDHGIRPDSAEDRRLVEAAAKRYGLPFVYAEGRLGPGASEATARRARYAFLERVRREHGARAIITAHQQDDLLETAILNILRGTGRRGLTSLRSTGRLLRPLLHVPKAELLAYAQQHHLRWHEDSTNTDERYLRNYIRRQIVPRLGVGTRDKLLHLIGSTARTNELLDAALSGLLRGQSDPQVLDRRWFAALPHAVAKELMAQWLRAHGLRSFDAATLERLVIAAKTLRPGSTVDIQAGAGLSIGKTSLALLLPER